MNKPRMPFPTAGGTYVHTETGLQRVDESAPDQVVDTKTAQAPVPSTRKSKSKAKGK